MHAVVPRDKPFGQNCFVKKSFLTFSTIITVFALKEPFVRLAVVADKAQQFKAP